MASSSRPPRQDRAASAGRSPVVTTVSGPADVAAMIPYLLGFQPQDSLVVVALEGIRKRFGPVLRVDLVQEPGLVEELTAQILQIVLAHRIGRVLLAAFSPNGLDAEPLVRSVLRRLRDHRVAVGDAFRADGKRWWSYVCDDPLCCSPSGVSYDVTTSAVAAEAVVAGLAFAPDRNAVRAQVAPADDLRRRLVAREVRRLRAAGAGAAQAVDAHALAVRVADNLPEPASTSAADVAWLGLVVQSREARDMAIAAIDRSNAAAHFELWRVVLSTVGDDLLPDVGAVAALAAWLDGQGVLASHVVDRVLEVDPHHGLAGLVGQLLAHAVNPRTWGRGLGAVDGDESPPPLAG
ncbi:MAG: DUF4192 domain-containing protein [Nocardioidaceae bacterium]